MARFQVGDIIKIVGEEYRNPHTGKIDDSLYIVLEKVLIKGFYFDYGSHKDVSVLCALCQPAFYPHSSHDLAIPIPIKNLELVQRP